MREAPDILVLGASGLIGRFVTDDLRRRGFRVIGLARRYASGPRPSPLDLEKPVMSMDADALAKTLRDHAIGVVVNCVGVLQDQPGSHVVAVHRDFVARLIAAIKACDNTIRLVHLSIPGSAAGDRTAYSRSKRQAERLIETSGIRYAILRPGFVIAPSAYGGSAMLRALALLPLRLPAALSATPFQPVAVEDIAATIAWLAGRDAFDTAADAVTWDLMQPEKVSLGELIELFRSPLGTATVPRLVLPEFSIDLGARLGDLVSYLGWRPPLRTTAIMELRRGVAGDPQPWMAATGLVPKTVTEILQRSTSIQDKWFARLFLIKPVIIATLSLFWIVSSLIALLISYPAAASILASHHFPKALVDPVTIGTSLMDLSIGVLIAFRRTAAAGLIAGILLSLGYMLGAAILTPDLWIEPLGALVKTGPAIVLMLVALLILDNR